MKRTAWTFLGILMVWAIITFESQADQSKPRLFVTDSVSWEISGGWGESGGTGGGGVKGGARPQTAEIIKTFGERCPEIIVNNKKEFADFVVILDHEGGKGIARRRNKIAVFNRSGDSIFSDSTRSLGNSVKDACGAIIDDFQHNPPKPVPLSAEAPHESPTASPAAPAPLLAAPVLPGASRAAGEDFASLTVKSTPDGADIMADGKFRGSTPSTLRLAPGDHTISVAAAGFKSWERTIPLSSGSSVTLNATLEKAQ